jgi:hypothetical protein
MNHVHVAVQEVVDQRAEHVTVDCRVTDISGGRLLAFFPQQTTSDGFAAEESDGFFDHHNVPPWDTWIYSVDDFVISFVPAQFVTHVECGLITNVEGCIMWLRDVDHPFVDMLQSDGLLS